MKLLLDEMYPATVAEQLRRRGHDAASIHEDAFRMLEGAPDEAVFAAALAAGRAIVTENVSDFRRLETEALSLGRPTPVFVFTTNRQFPRGHPATTGRIVLALDSLLEQPSQQSTVFLTPPTGS